GEVAAVEGVDRRVRAAGDLLRRLGAEIGHHRHTASVAGEQVVHTLIGPHVREVVERKGDVARPHMGDTHAVELWKAVDHVLVQDRRTYFRWRRRETGAAAEDEVPAVG